MGIIPQAYPERFWKRVNRTDGCWVWTASTVTGGYGKFWDGKRHVRAHRYAWEMVNGPVPNGLEVLHTCDNPPCVNPAHLFLGTQADNMRDMVRKGRMWTQQHPDRAALNLDRIRPLDQRGELNGRARFTADDIRKIRQMAADGVTQREIARIVGMSRSHVAAIVLRKKWRHLP